MDPSQTRFQQQLQSPGFALNPNNKFRREYPPRSFPASTMNPSELTLSNESGGMDMWSSPPAPILRKPRPATIHEAGFTFCLPEEFGGLPAWDSSTLATQEISDHFTHQNYSMPQDFYHASSGCEDNWQAKTCDDIIEMNMDTDMTIGQAFTTDEAVPILDLRQSTFPSESNFESSYNPRRMSGSSFTMSTTGLSEMQSFEDFSTTLSDATSFISDYPPPSNRNSLMSSTQLSPVASPRMTPQNRSELVRTQSRGRASPSPRPSMRSAPYNIDSTRSKRWSTGSYAPTRRQSPFVFHQNAPELFTPAPRMSSRHSSPTLPPAHLPLNMSNLQTQQFPFLASSNQGFHRSSMLLPSSNPTFSEHSSRFDTPPPVLSHGLFRMLQSNADPHTLHTHYADLSDPPDLYASLQEEPLPPPPEDMNPSDPDLVPHEQELRFPGDLYTPRWVRGHGNKREGWCGICKPGRWLVLKNSAFWYDKSFTHGISAATGAAFQEPGETRRMDGNPDVWEGSCGSCGEWVALVSSKKKGTTWFRHAYKCHTHPKIKDAPKRRRESSHSRNLVSTTSTTSSGTLKPPSHPTSEVPRVPPMTPQRSAQSRSAPADGTPLTRPGSAVNVTPINPLQGLAGMI